MKLSKKIKRSVVYIALSAVIKLFNLVPRNLAVNLGGWIGLAVWWLSGKERYKINRHLSLVYGQNLKAREKEKIGRDFCINSGKNYADVLRFPGHYQSEILPIVSCEGLENFQSASDRGKGVLGITGHIGNFELLAAFIASSGFNTAVIGRELYDTRLDELLLANRRAVGLTTFATTGSPKKLLAWLKAGNTLGVLIDTDSHRVRGDFIPAFGRWSHTPVGQTMIGLKVGAAFCPTACLRRPDNGYHVIVRPAIEIQPRGDFNTDVYNMTLACTRELEAIILAHPDQWIWMHNRWRTRRTDSK